MAKTKTSYVCSNCGAVHARWLGKCPDCGTWDALEAVRQTPASKTGSTDHHRNLADTWNMVADQEDDPSELNPYAPTATPVEQVTPVDTPRYETGISELDRVLGGGFVYGSTGLMGGEPGIGKSTLLLQAAANLARAGRTVLYVTSEESAHQIQLRAERLSAINEPEKRLLILADTNLDRIAEQARLTKPAVLIIDSIQMVYKSDIEASPGTMTQPRRCCVELVYLAKASGMGVVLIGHVTKEGQVAGPRLLEHLVDAVMYFEGDRYHAHRIVRAIKNRYGTTLEIGLFEMTGKGLLPVTDPTNLSPDGQHGKEPRPGSVICPVLQGSRCFLVEVQALTTTGILGAAKRRTSGLDANRLAMIIAILEKHVGLRLADQDIFVQSVGGLRLAEPAVDLPLALAIAGAHMNRAAPPRTVAVGEIGLDGCIRSTTQIEKRMREAGRLGYENMLFSGAPTNTHLIEKLTVQTISEAIESLT